MRLLYGRLINIRLLRLKQSTAMFLFYGISIGSVVGYICSSSEHDPPVVDLIHALRLHNVDRWQLFGRTLSFSIILLLLVC
ncbi:hypothetical protein DL98DRAFT_655919 [Cadophora sp. DSE1049]|nr:hypothetical protein DL98DRAFT_655919 [Cadophora sp. DSE1049]